MIVDRFARLEVPRCGEFVGARARAREAVLWDRLPPERGQRAQRPLRALPAFRRQAIPEHCFARSRARSDELAAAWHFEAGEPINDHTGEVTPLIDT
ncbi:hypothetical protein CF642_38415 [Burkholderia pseudomallei]|nr:hypothetical protein CF642_38415 [Burkholderia pseudomallei]